MLAQRSFAGTHAVVIGGSMGGLLAARVLSDHFEQVTLIERDAVQDVPEPRKGQPQVRHLHGLLGRGFQIMTHYFPELPEALVAGGALVDDMGRHMHWYCFGDYRCRLESGLRGVLASRPFLEWHIRQFTLARANITLLDRCSVKQLLTSEDTQRVNGVELLPAADPAHPFTLSADLVVDSSGRGSASPRWLDALGYRAPEESEVKVRLGYATRLYRRNPAAPNARDWIFLTPEAPDERRGGGAFPLEGERWIVTLAGWHGDHPPADEAGFLDFAASLPTSDIYQIASENEPLSEIMIHKFPSSLRRHYEKMTRFPEGYLVMGDAVCSFNPIYGQGMTSAALQAAELDSLLARSHGQSALALLAPRFFQRIAKVIDIPWQMTVGEDFRYPETTGKKAPGTDFINAYVARVHRATHNDPVVGAAFLRVMNLIDPPSHLFHPRVLLRVLRQATPSPRHSTTPRPVLQASEQSN